jgi:hypothetical protein
VTVMIYNLSETRSDIGINFVSLRLVTQI